MSHFSVPYGFETNAGNAGFSPENNKPSFLRTQESIGFSGNKDRTYCPQWRSREVTRAIFKLFARRTANGFPLPRE